MEYLYLSIFEFEKALLPEWSKGVDLRPTVSPKRVGSNPTGRTWIVLSAVELFRPYFLLHSFYVILYSFYFILHTFYFILFTFYFLLLTFYFLFFTLYFILFAVYISHFIFQFLPLTFFSLLMTSDLWLFTCYLWLLKSVYWLPTFDFWFLLSDFKLSAFNFFRSVSTNFLVWLQQWFFALIFVPSFAFFKLLSSQNVTCQVSKYTRSLYSGNAN